MARGYRKRTNKRAKWRQQKLSVGTVAKIAKKIAKKLDKKNIRYYYSNLFFARDGFSWDSVTEICPNNQYRSILSGNMESQIISDIGHQIFDWTAASGLDQSESSSITVRVSGIEARLSFRNPNINQVKITAQLLFIPNLNKSTSDGVDFLRPDVFMLYKYGGGNLLYDGMAKTEIRNKSTGRSSVRKYTVIDRKVFTIEGSSYSGENIVEIRVLKRI